MHNQEAHVWVMHSKEELGYGDVVSTYTMYVGKVRKEPSMANAQILLLVLFSSWPVTVMHIGTEQRWYKSICLIALLCWCM